LKKDAKMNLRVFLWFFVLAALCHDFAGAEDSESDNSELNESNVDESGDDEDDCDGDDLEIERGLDIDHFFTYKVHKTQTGKNKGAERLIVSLVVPPYTFKRRKNPKYGNAEFSCNSCQAVHYSCTARARKVPNGHKNGHDLYILETCSQSHMCSPSPTQWQVGQFRQSIFDRIAADPTECMPDLYEQVRAEFLKVRF
jgi:hypothetical protein